MSGDADKQKNEGGWDFDDGGQFVSEHTCVDPTLLERLAALDEKEDDAISLDDHGDLFEMVDDDDEGVSALGADDFEEIDEIDVGDATMAMQLPVEPDDDDGGDSTLAMDLSGAGPAAGEAARMKSSPPEVKPEPTIQLDESLNYDEMPAEKTQLFTPAFEEQPTRAKLIIVQGGGQQKEYLLARDRVTMGRGTNNDILIPDIAISRQHCEVIRVTDGHFRLRDMSSGNGTKLNGAKILDADLCSGDRIEIGGTILELQLEGASATGPSQRKINFHPSENEDHEPPPEPKPRHSGNSMPDYSAPGSGATMMTDLRLQPGPEPQASSSSNIVITLAIVAFGGLFLLLAGIIGAKVYLDYSGGDAAVATSKPASDYYFEGMEFAKSKDWDTAEARFKSASDLARDEGAVQVRKDAKAQLELVQRERGFLKAFDRGTSLGERKEFEEAISVLESVRSGSAYYDDTRDLVKRFKATWSQELIDDASKAFDDSRYGDADKKISKALSLAPENDDAKAIDKKLRELPTEEYVPEEPPPVVAARPRTPRNPTPAGTRPPKATGDAKPKPKPKAKPDKPAASGKVDTSAAVALFRGRQFGPAAAALDKIAAADTGTGGKKAAALAKKVRGFETSYNSGKSAFSGRNYGGAIAGLSKALRLDRSIAGGAFAAEIKDMLAEAHYQQAKAALNGNNYQAAGGHVKKAIRYKPSHPGNQALVSKLEKRAKGMYVDAINKKGADPAQAKRIARSIVAMLPSSSETFKKARRLLSEL